MPRLLVLVLLLSAIMMMVTPAASAQQQLHLRHRKPHPSELAQTARWLMHESTWGVLSTLSTATGAPFGNPQSCADGPYGNKLFGDNSTGLPYFYVSEMDVSQIDVAANPDGLVAFTVSEAALPGGCQMTDPESPLCVRLTVTGRLVVVEEGEERAFALQALFDRHPAMPNWPTDHDWVVKKLEPAHIFALDMFGGAKPLSVDEYLAAEL